MLLMGAQGYVLKIIKLFPKIEKYGMIRELSRTAYQELTVNRIERC